MSLWGRNEWQELRGEMMKSHDSRNGNEAQSGARKTGGGVSRDQGRKNSSRCQVGDGLHTRLRVRGVAEQFCSL